MVTGLIRILAPGTQTHEGLAADAAAFSGECFSGLGWLCETKARSCLSQMHLFSETSKSGVAKNECYSWAPVLSHHLSLGGLRCWNWLQFLHCSEMPSRPESLWRNMVEICASACPSCWRREHSVFHTLRRHTWCPVQIFHLLKDKDRGGRRANHCWPAWLPLCYNV